jgi:hypothetical protein
MTVSDDYPDAWKTAEQRASETNNQTTQWLKGLRSGLPTEPREDQDAYPTEWR